MIALTARTPAPVSHDLENILPPQREALLRGLAGQLQTSTHAADQNLGHLEETLLRGGHELFRQMMLEKAAAAPPLCPHCQNKLRRLTESYGTTIQTRHGDIRIERARGHCRRCNKWRFTADALLDLPDQGTQSPALLIMEDGGGRWGCFVHGAVAAHATQHCPLFRYRLNGGLAR